MPTLEQAIRNAVAAEQAAQRFYLELVPKAEDEKVRKFFEEMAEQEAEHAKSIETMGERIANGELPAHPNDRIAGVETAPGWQSAERISIDEALELAISAEQNAALYYDAIADFFSDEGAQFFRELSACEQQHADRLVEMRDRGVG